MMENSHLGAHGEKTAVLLLPAPRLISVEQLIPHDFINSGDRGLFLPLSEHVRDLSREGDETYLERVALDDSNGSERCPQSALAQDRPRGRAVEDDAIRATEVASAVDARPLGGQNVERVPEEVGKAEALAFGREDEFDGSTALEKEGLIDEPSGCVRNDVFQALDHVRDEFVLADKVRGVMVLDPGSRPDVASGGRYRVLLREHLLDRWVAVPVQQADAFESLGDQWVGDGGELDVVQPIRFDHPLRVSDWRCEVVDDGDLADEPPTDKPIGAGKETVRGAEEGDKVRGADEGDGVVEEGEGELADGS